MVNFVNPYNFIPMSSSRGNAYENEDQRSGVIHYTVTTKSPLFIPNTTTEHAFPGFKSADGKDEHKSFDFYSYDILEEGVDYQKEYHKPVIPGSELRGMFRSLYETLTDSCMAVLNADTVPVKRSVETFKAGLLERKADGSFALYSAEDCILRIFDYKDRSGKNHYKKIYDDYALIPHKEGTHLYYNKRISESKERRFTIKPDTNAVFLAPNEATNTDGYLIRGEKDGDIKKKSNCHLFSKKQLLGEYPITNEVLDGLKEVLASYQKESEGDKAYEEYKTQYDLFLAGKGEKYFPVYYSVINNQLLYLSCACYTKERAHHSVGELVGDLKPCTKKVDMCPACSLFGMSGKKNDEAVASKVRFADSRPKENISAKDYYDPIVTLQILDMPKISNSEFYLEKPDDAQYWTYDYYINDCNITVEAARLRGRKYYWHQPGKKLPLGVERGKQNRTIRPVKSGITFEGKVYYDRISTKQLDQLIWLLNGGSDGDRVGKGELGYKLGGGKPLGLGSIVCKVTAVDERKVALNGDSIDYEIVPYKEKLNEIAIPYSKLGFSDTIRDEFLTICSLDAVAGKRVSYPVNDRQARTGEIVSEGYSWFTENHRNLSEKMPNKRTQMMNKRTQIYIREILPHISEESPIERGAILKEKSAGMSVGTEYTATIQKIEGKNIKFVVNGTFYPKLKVGENGIANMDRKMIKSAFEGKEAVLRYDGADKNGKEIWTYIRMI